MAGGIAKLKSLHISRPLKRGYHSDGGGLYLQVSATGAKSWVFRFQMCGKVREMGLGSFMTLSLAEARDLARDCRKMVLMGIDPIESRKNRRLEETRLTLQTKTFDECAAAYIEAHKASWRNEKHARQWSASLGTYVSPVMGTKPVREIDTLTVLKVLQPIWSQKSETATRVRGRIESILDWAKVCGYRDGENPARWKGHISKLLPAQGKIAKVKHHAALHYSELPNFLMQLKKDSGVGSAALEFAILTAARTGEVIGATWAEINFEQRQWTIPDNRMKGSREHKVPLSTRAVAILRTMEALAGGAAVFPGHSENGHLSNMALLAVLKRMGCSEITTHGFRSTFRDWVAECTSYPREVAEMALAHAIENQVEAAYRRGDLFDKRKNLMGDWANYCLGESQPISISTQVAG